VTHSQRSAEISFVARSGRPAGGSRPAPPTAAHLRAGEATRMSEHRRMPRPSANSPLRRGVPLAIPRACRSINRELLSHDFASASAENLRENFSCRLKRAIRLIGPPAAVGVSDSQSSTAIVAGSRAGVIALIARDTFGCECSSFSPWPTAKAERTRPNVPGGAASPV
jgi:hypothetical protein